MLFEGSPPRGGVDRNVDTSPHDPADLPSPPRGGADRNRMARGRLLVSAVAPSRGRGSKPRDAAGNYDWTQSPPRGGVDRNLLAGQDVREVGGRPLAGAWIETTRSR